ncbi:MAG: ATP-binding protein, partial [Planctomycetaceae bacterium]|nr:ATP-binding protein [Planctomycetaceae bacterium]
MADAHQRNIPFKVDIAGIIEIMGTSLYSRLDTPVRELIQNANDAIMRRRRGDLTFRGRIDVRQDATEGTISVEDNGIGLTSDEAESYLGTLGIGITGMIKRGRPPETSGNAMAAASDLIGQFGIGLFSGFMLADRITVDSLRADGDAPVRWEAGAGTDITLCEGTRQDAGTRVTLHLKPEFRMLSRDAETLEHIIHEYADFLSVPIHLNDAERRVNVINAAWLDATPDLETVELELEGRFGETPLDIIPIRVERPVSVAGVLSISPQRVPGFSESGTVMVTVRRMVISRRVQDLLPPWASFLRGVLELHDCSPTASREDLVRNEAFEAVSQILKDRLYGHLESLTTSDPTRLQSIIAWHRYTFAGASLEDARLRTLLRKVYQLPTTAGQLTIDEILKRSSADPLHEPDADRVVWYNTDRRQEQWINQLFASHDVPCVHTFRSFEESLLAQVIADDNASGIATDFRAASAGSRNFAESILGMHDMEDAPPEWQNFLDSTGARVLTASYPAAQPVMAFLNERYE